MILERAEIALDVAAVPLVVGSIGESDKKRLHSETPASTPAPNRVRRPDNDTPHPPYPPLLVQVSQHPAERRPAT